MITDIFLEPLQKHKKNFIADNFLETKEFYINFSFKSIFHDEVNLSLTDYFDYITIVKNNCTKFYLGKTWAIEDSSLLEYSFEYGNKKIDVVEMIGINNQHKIDRITVFARTPSTIQQFKDYIQK